MLRQKGTLKYTLIILWPVPMNWIGHTEKQVVSTMTVLHPWGICGAFLFVKMMGVVILSPWKIVPYVLVGIHVGENPVYNNVSIEPVSYIKNTMYFLHDFNIHWTHQSYNYNVEGKFLHCFIKTFTMIFQNVQLFWKILLPRATFLVAFVANTKFQTSGIVCVCSCPVQMCKQRDLNPFLIC